MEDTIVETKWRCNVCGEEYKYRSEACQCCPDVIEVEYEFHYYKTRSGEYKKYPKPKNITW